LAQGKGANFDLNLRSLFRLPILSFMTRAPDTGQKPKKSANTNDRSVRLAVALRANLQRRKAQERGRGAQTKPAGKDEGR